MYGISSGYCFKRIDLDNQPIVEANINYVTNTERGTCLKKNDVIVSSMHPGWVDTPGLKKSLPVFSGYLGKRLRSVAEGADTIYWLAASSNKRCKGC
mgnify:CR=1 FL=1